MEVFIALSVIVVAYFVFRLGMNMWYYFKEKYVFCGDLHSILVNIDMIGYIVIAIMLALSLVFSGDFIDKELDWTLAVTITAGVCCLLRMADNIYRRRDYKVIKSYRIDMKKVSENEAFKDKIVRVDREYCIKKAEYSEFCEGLMADVKAEYVQTTKKAILSVFSPIVPLLLAIVVFFVGIIRAVA